MSFYVAIFSLLGAIGFFLTLDMRSRLDRAERAIRALEAQLLFRAPVQPPAAAETAPSPPLAGDTPPQPSPPPTSPAQGPAFAPPSRPKRPSGPSLEEAIGTRWVVY